MRVPSGRRAILIALSLAVAGAGAGDTVVAPVAKEARGWVRKMKGLESALNDLLFAISSDARFENPKNFKSIEVNAARVAKLAHSITGKTANSPDRDQSLDMISRDFSDEADYAVNSLKAGHRAYARVILGSMTSYCISCHTRTDAGPSFADVKGDPRLERLPPFAKGDYLVAVREFDRALSEFQKISENEAIAKQQIYDYERALRYGLSVAVRVKRDPDLALKLVDAVIANGNVPYYLKAQSRDWKKSLLEWKNEKPFSGANAEKLLAEATRLVGKAREVQKFPADRSADMIYLRASATTHELLGLAPKGEMGSKALYLAGLSYDVLYDYGIKDFGELYYQSCIRMTPHSEIARECYRRYEKSVYFGYTGSGGTYIPSDVRAKMNELEALSAVTPDIKSNTSDLR